MRDPRISGYREKWRADIPLRYDHLLSHHLMWPSLSARWGPVRQQHRHYSEQLCYLAEQTDGSAPNTLLLANVPVPKPGSISPEFLVNWDDDDVSSMVGILKVVYHPGEVNRIRELPQFPQILATHTDGQDVYIWNMEAQTDRSKPQSSEDEDGDGADVSSSTRPSLPDLLLKGHTAPAQFALATSPSAPFVLSGGTDKKVALWGLQDHVSRAASDSSGGGGGGSDDLPAPRLHARALYSGHTETVEDVAFHCQQAELFASVGDDLRLLLWDSRAGTSPVTKVERAHAADLHCVDWSAVSPELLLTGAADATVKVFDRRRLSTAGRSEAVHTFRDHSEAVLCVQWHPERAGVFASGGDDGMIDLIDVSKLTADLGSPSEQKLQATAGSANTKEPPAAGKKGRPGKGGAASASAPSPGAGGLPLSSPEREGSGKDDGRHLFKHVGHREKVCEFHWNPVDPWTMLSSSIDSGKIGGGTLQVWRTLDFIHLSEEEALNKLTALLQQ